LAAFVAIAAFVIAYLQLESSRDLQLKTMAQDSFQEYLKLTIDEPLFAEGIRTCSRDSCKKHEQNYEWFVSFFLHAAEQVYLVYPDDEGWNRALSNQLCFHRDYLNSPDFVDNTSKHHAQLREVHRSNTSDMSTEAGLNRRISVGAREHHARYLGTAALSAHTWCEWGAVCTCEPPHPA
jgi:hypothetical protein